MISNISYVQSRNWSQGDYLPVMRKAPNGETIYGYLHKSDGDKTIVHILKADAKARQSDTKVSFKTFAEFVQSEWVLGSFKIHGNKG